MPEILFVTLKVISGHKRKAQNENNYSETKKTLLIVSTRKGHLPTNCRVGRKGGPMYLPSDIW